MEKKIGFIGCGNMGTAMIQGILESGKCPPQEMMISCRTKKTLEEKKAQFGVQISTDNRDVAAFADILFVAVKPQFYAEVLEEIKDLLTEEQILVGVITAPHGVRGEVKVFPTTDDNARWGNY